MGAIAEYVLDDLDRYLFDAIFKAKSSASAQRNDLAHGLFCVVFGEPDGIGWVSTKDRIQFALKLDAAHGRGEGLDFEAIKKRVFVYKLPDLAV